MGSKLTVDESQVYYADLGANAGKWHVALKGYVTQQELETLRRSGIRFDPCP